MDLGRRSRERTNIITQLELPSGELQRRPDDHFHDIPALHGADYGGPLKLAPVHFPGEPKEEPHSEEICLPATAVEFSLLRRAESQTVYISLYVSAYADKTIRAAASQDKCPDLKVRRQHLHSPSKANRESSLLQGCLNSPH